MRPTSVLVAYFRGLSYRRKSAFTLVELLVVISIIAVLISLLLPALHRARDAANSAQCMSNLRQQGQAVQMYQSDSGGFLPPYRLTTKYPYVTQPYIFQYLPMLYQTAGGETWRCPVDNFFDTYDDAVDRLNNYFEPLRNVEDMSYSYALNYDLPTVYRNVYPTKGLKDSPYAYKPYLIAQIRTPAAAAILVETNSPAAVEHSIDPFYLRFNHIKNTAMNVLFVDGHVESRTQKEMMSADTANADDLAAWPPGFSDFWFGVGGATGPVYVGGP